MQLQIFFYLLDLISSLCSYFNKILIRAWFIMIFNVGARLKNSEVDKDSIDIFLKKRFIQT